MSMLCSQCGTAAERCPRCAGALCARRLCGQLHEAACDDAVNALASAPTLPTTRTVYAPRTRPRRQRDPEVERLIAHRLVVQITHHRHTGRAASLLGRGTDPEAFHVAYRQAGLDPLGAFTLYLAASRLDSRTA